MQDSQFSCQSESRQQRLTKVPGDVTVSASTSIQPRHHDTGRSGRESEGEEREMSVRVPRLPVCAWTVTSAAQPCLTMMGAWTVTSAAQPCLTVMGAWD